MVGRLHNLDVHTVRRSPSDPKSRAGQGRLVLAIKFVAMPVPLRNFQLPVRFLRKRSGLEFAGPRAEPHGPAHLVHAQQLAQLVNHAVRRRRIKLRAVRVLHARNLPSVFDRGALHAQTNPEKRNFALPRIGNCVNHARNSPLPESAGNQNPIHMPQALLRGRQRIDFFGFDPLNHHALPIRQPAMAQRFAQTFVRVFQLHVLAHHSDADFAGRMLQRFQHRQPAAQIPRRCFQMQQSQNLFVQAFRRQGHRHFINVAHVRRGNHAGLRDVAEQGDFRFQVGAEVPVAAANQNVRLNPDAQHFLHAVLGRLGFQFARGGNKRHQREMHENHILRAQFQTHLPDRFQKRQRFNVAHRAANFDEHNIHAFGHFAEGGFNFVGDVRNHLHGFAQVIPAPFLGDDRFVKTPGGPVVVARQMCGGKPFVVPQVQIGLGAIVGDKDFAMLIGRHGAGINVQVGIALLEGNFKSAAFKQAGHGGGCHAFPERRNHATRHKHIFGGGAQVARNPPGSTRYKSLCGETLRVSNHDSLDRKYFFSGARQESNAAFTIPRVRAGFSPLSRCLPAHPR